MSAPTRPARKRAPKKAAPAQPAAAAGGIPVVRIGERDAEPEAAEMVTIFSIDDTDYQIPKQLDPHAGLRFLWQASTVGIDLALSNLVIEVLGPENLLALEQAPKITREDIRDVFAAVRQHVLGTGAVLQVFADPS